MKPFTEEDRYVYDLTPDSMVVDAGAYRGDFTAEIVKRYNCQVVALEPIDAFYRQVVARFKDNPKVAVVHAAIGTCPHPQHVFVKGDSSGWFADSKEFEISPTWCLPEEPNDLGIIDLLKLNIEGAEFEVLEYSIDRGLTKRLRNIQVQFHPVVQDAQHRYEWIRVELLKTHHLTFDAPWCWENYQLNE